VLWGEPAQPDPAKGWDGVDANVLLVAFEGAQRDGVPDDGEPVGEEGGGAAVGGQGLAFGARLQQQLQLGGGVLAAAGPTHHTPAVVHDERGDPAAVAGASVDGAFALAASPGCHATAILAFVVQLIVYVVQTATANQQLMQAQQLHGATLEILAQIQERSEGTQATVATINERLLAHILGKALPEASAAGIDPESPEFSKIVADNVARRVAEIEQRRIQRPKAAPVPVRNPVEDAAIFDYMGQYRNGRKSTASNRRWMAWGKEPDWR
jgi:hypothetical protein